MKPWGDRPYWLPEVSEEREMKHEKEVYEREV
jgi:hypothetical protein